MKTQHFDEQSAELHFAFAELLTINNALNEVCNGLDDFEFETRMGAEKADVLSLLASVGKVVELMQKSKA